MAKFLRPIIGGSAAEEVSQLGKYSFLSPLTPQALQPKTPLIVIVKIVCLQHSCFSLTLATHRHNLWLGMVAANIAFLEGGGGIRNIFLPLKQLKEKYLAIQLLE